MPISKVNLGEIAEDDRISDDAKRLLFAFFDHDGGQDADDPRWAELRALLKELQEANYLMRGDAWKSQAGGHLLLFDRWQAPTVEMHLPPLPPKNFGRDVLYVVGQPGTSIVKIGVTRSLPARLKSLQTGSPVLLSVLWWHPGSYDLEDLVHREFKSQRLAGEWFDFGVEEPDLLIDAFVNRLRPDEFPPDVAADESLMEYLDRYPPGCRYANLLNQNNAPVAFPR